MPKSKAPAMRITAGDHAAIKLEELEHAVAVMAFIVLEHGPTYAPLLERLERELDAARSGPEVRARRILEEYVNKRRATAAAPLLLSKDD